jgi:4-hydroxymandelate oxidase
MDLLTIEDFEVAAQQKLPAMVYDYFSSGAQDELTLKENCRAYERIKLHYRVLVDVSKRDLQTTVLGQNISMPLLIAPTAFQRLSHPDGEIATARAAGAAGTIMVLSTLSTSSIEEVLAAATGPIWYQLYVYRDREITKDLIQRAEAAGCSAIVMTVDLPVSGRRIRDVRNRFRLPEGLTLKNFKMPGLGNLPSEVAESGLTTYVESLLDPSLSWKDIAWLRSITKLPILLKGIVRADDARRAVEHDVNAIIVSNHGGRQLDTAPATIEVLGRISQEVGGQIEVLVDGGIRRGTDVIKAIATGARAVLSGRPILWGLSSGGERGVLQVLDLFRTEIDQAMALCGCPTVADITPDLVNP